MFQELARVNLNGYVSGMADAKERLIRISGRVGDDETANAARKMGGGFLVVSDRAQRELTNAAKVESRRWVHEVEDRCRKVLLNTLGAEEYDRELIAVQLGNVIRSFVDYDRGEQFAARWGRRAKIRDKAQHDEWQRTRMPFIKYIRSGRVIDDAIEGNKKRANNPKLTAAERAQARQKAEQLERAKAGKGKPPSVVKRVEMTKSRTAWNDSYNRAVVDMAQRVETVQYLQWHTARELGLGGSPVCEICDAYTLLTLPKGHTRWGTHKPPLHYNCRCMLVEVTRAVAKEYKIKATPKKDQPDWDGDNAPAEGFGG